MPRSGISIAAQLEDGYLGTYPPQDRFIDYGDKGYEPAENLPLWDVWAHKYNLLGLLNYYRRTGFEPALQASRRIGDLLCKTYGDRAGQKSIVRNDWHVGMANTSVLEPMAMLYRYTGDAKYLEFCRYIVRAWDEPKGPKIATTLIASGHVNEVANAKAYEMTSNLVGLLELHLATGDEAYLRPVLRAWEDIVKNRLYLSGTTSWGELFRADHLLRADGRVGEGCVTTTWMQLNLRLLELTGEAKYADEIERTIYNALLGAQHPKTGLVCYFTPLNGAKAVRCRRSGSARRELLHVEHSARAQPDPFSRLGRARRRHRREPVRARHRAAHAAGGRRHARVEDAIPGGRRCHPDAADGEARPLPAVDPGAWLVPDVHGHGRRPDLDGRQERIRGHRSRRGVRTIRSPCVWISHRRFSRAARRIRTRSPCREVRRSWRPTSG